MKSTLFVIAFALAAAMLMDGLEEFTLVLLAGLVGYLFSQNSTLKTEIQALQNKLTSKEKQAVAPVKNSVEEPQKPTDSSPEAEPHKIEQEEQEVEPKELPAPEHSEPVFTNQLPKHLTEPSFIERGWQYVSNYFTGGNLFVRIGIILLFFGVSFLLRYVSEQGLFPIEYRIISTLVAGVALLAFGWHLRHKKPLYALLLQGAAIGILYLTIFASYSMFKLIPAIPAFGLLFVLSMLATALAVLQNALPLAMLGFVGGFLAPILASSGSNNYIALFTYYLILNLAILAIAWFKAWRPLNLLGFIFTVSVGILWSFFHYDDDKWLYSQGFLIAFFLLFVTIAILFALRQPPKLKGLADGSLLFGTPIAAWSLQYGMWSETEYGVAISSFVLGCFYLVLSILIKRFFDTSLKLVSETFLALGIIFSSLTIPFAVSPMHTTAVWGLEAAGLIWLGSRQNRLYMRAFGYGLYILASLFVLDQLDHASGKPFFNEHFLGFAILGIAAILIAFLLFKPFNTRRNFETHLSPLALFAGSLWIIAGVAHQIITQYDQNWLVTGLLLTGALLTLSLILFGRQNNPTWDHTWYLLAGLIVLMIGCTVFYWGGDIHRLLPPSHHYGWLAWPLAFATLYLGLFLLDIDKQTIMFIDGLHWLGGTLLILLITWEGYFYLNTTPLAQTDWHLTWLAIPAFVGSLMIINTGLWPINNHNKLYKTIINQSLLTVLAIWMIISFFSPGITKPVLSWLPFLNPLDMLFATLVWLTYRSNNTIKPLLENSLTNKIEKVYITIIAGLAFVWLNVLIFRIAHHFFNTPYRLDNLLDSSLVQSSMSILWAITGVLLTILASRKAWRKVWFIGGGLLLLVVIKLFLVDLSEIGTFARIISFLVVGSLLTSIGYFAPLPEDENEKASPGLETNS